MIGSAVYIYREVERIGKNGIYWFLVALFIGPTAILVWSLFFKQPLMRHANLAHYGYSPYPYYYSYNLYDIQKPYDIQYPTCPQHPENLQNIPNEYKNDKKETKVEIDYDIRDDKLINKVDRLTTGNIIALFISAIVTAIYLSTAAIVIALSFVPNLSEQNAIFDALLTPQMILLQVAIQDFALVFSVYYHVIRKGAITFEDMGLSWNRLKPYQNIPLGIIFGIALFAFSAIIEFAISNFIDTSSFNYGNAYAFNPEAFPEYIALIIAGTFFAPVSEEIFFRGYAFKAWLSKSGNYAAYILSSLFFSIVHFNIVGMVPIFLAGLGLAYIYHKTGSLFPGMLAHAVNNFIALTIIFMS